MRGNKRPRENRFRKDAAELPVLDFGFMESLELCLKVIMIVVLIILSSLIFIFIHDTITQSKYFSLKKISIAGCRKIRKSEIIRQAGIFPGENIFAINLFKVKKRLVANDWISDALLERNIPSGLFISIKEQHPVAAVQMGKQKVVLINKNGIPFTDYDHIKFHDGNMPLKGLHLPLVKGLELGDKDGTYGFSGKLFNFVMGFLSGAYDVGRPVNFFGKIEQIIVDRDMGIDLKIMNFPSFSSASEKGCRMDEGLPMLPLQKNINSEVTLKMGFDAYQARYKKLERIIDYLKTNHINKRISVIDLSDLKNVVVKFQQTENRGNLPDSIKGGV